MDALRLRGVFYFACHPALHLRLASVNDVDARLLTGGGLVREKGVFESLHVIGGRRRMNKQCNVTSTE